MLDYISPYGKSMMYCNGAEHPLYRGKLHGFFSLLIPYGWMMINKKCNNKMSKMIFSIYIFFSLMLYVTSYIYHVHSYKYGMYIEDLFLKLDRSLTMLSISSNFTPVSMFVLHKTGKYLLFLQWTLSIIGMINIFVYNKTLWYEPLIIGSAYLVFLGEMKDNMTSYEYNMMNGSCILSLIGGIIYGFEINLPIINKDTWGHHENFHLCVVIAEIMVYMLNYNMACRIANN
jgi:channel protein (hemolysin III family)